MIDALPQFRDAARATGLEPPDVIEPSEAAALNTARRWKHAGRCVRIARPPRGMDFNDVLLGRLALEHERVA